MNDSLRKVKSTLEPAQESYKLLSGKDRIKLIQGKEPKNTLLKQAETNYVPKQAGRDWWWCDDV
jgi:hypothetical protein